MKQSPYIKLLLSAFTIGLTAVLLTMLVSQVSAETTKQKRERLKVRSSRPVKLGSSYVGLKFGGITGAHAKFSRLNLGSPTNTWTASLFVDARAARQWYVGIAADFLHGSAFGITNTLLDASMHLKFNPLGESRITVRPAVALGYAVLPSKLDVPKATFFSKKLFIEGRIRLTRRFGLVGDFGKWWVTGGNEFGDGSGNCVYSRLGIWLI